MKGSWKSINSRLCLNRLGDHVFEKDFEGHGMPAPLMGNKEFAVALKGAAVITDLVFIVVAVERQFKFIEAEPGVVFSVSFRFFQLADQSVIHGKLLLN